MNDQVFRVEYFVTTAEDRIGEGGELGMRLKQEGINLLAMSAFPIGKGKIQVDLIPERPDLLTKAAPKLGLTLAMPKVAFLAHGIDRPGAMGELMTRLGNARVNLKATQAIASGDGRFGALLWVDQKDIELASRALGAVGLATHFV